MGYDVTLGLLVPINSNKPLKQCPVPRPDAPGYSIVRVGDGWGIFWEMAVEEDCAPETQCDLNWLVSMGADIGRRYVLAHGHQYGAPRIVLMELGTDEYPNMESITRFDYTTGERAP